jgi:RNA polymerase sigma-70 factor (ECF subfamily)
LSLSAAVRRPPGKGLDQIRSARSRRERPHDASEIEFVPGRPAAAGHERPGDPADRVTLDDGVRLALLVVLQRLSPAERVVFVLHDIFGVPFESVAQTVGRTAPTCRQLARRARQKIQANQGGVAFDVAAAEHRQVTEKFIAACATGDLDGLLGVLAPDAWGELDGGPGQRGPRGAVRGALPVARILLHFWGPGTTLVTQPVAGQPAVLGFAGRRLFGVVVFTLRGRRIQAVHVISDPRQLSFVSAQLG